MRPLAGTLLLVGVLVLAFSRQGAHTIHAGTPDVDLSIDVVGAGCDTKGTNPAKCELVAGSMFTVRVSINAFSGLPNVDGDAKAGYVGLQVRLVYSDGLIPKQRAGSSEIVWPDCVFASESKSAQSYLAGCSTGATANESVFVGPVVEVDFGCLPGSRQITLVHGVPTGTSPVGDTHIVDEALGEVAEAGSESLTINCIPGVGGIAERPEVVHMSVEADSAPGLGANVIALATLGTTVAVVLGSFAWFRRRRRAL